MSSSATTLEEAPTVGIDLGTTNSCISVYQNGKCIVIPIDNQNTMPSCVSFGKEGRQIGNKAKEDSILNPTNTVFDVKRYIGCCFDSTELQKDINRYLYEIFDDNGNPKIRINSNNQELIFAPEELSSMVLGKLKQCAEKFFGKIVCKAVITVPAHFKDSQRQATIDAGRIAGLDSRRIINEPTAAALAFRVREKYESDTEERNILVYDFGGGTFDVSIVTLDSGVLDVKATNGDTHLGGNDIDECLVEYFKNKFEEENNMSLDKNPRALRRLRMQSERAKKDLSFNENATIDLDELLNNVSFYCGITRAKFEDLCKEKIEKTLLFVAQALADANLDKTKIDDILLIGGSTRIPLVRKLLKDFFNGKELNTSLDPDLAVSMGAAIQAAILDGHDNQTTGTLLLLDVTPLSLGIETAGGIMATIISRNSPIPARVTKKFSNEKDFQLKVKIAVYEGERPLVEDNNKLGEFIMLGITPRIRGKTYVNVTFEINTDGILHLTAEELTEETNNVLSVEVDKGRLSENEIMRMISTAQILQKEDEQKKQIIQARIALESFCFDTKHKAKDIINNTEDCEIITQKFNEVLAWIEENQSQSKDVYEKKKRETNEYIRPILMKYL